MSAGVLWEFRCVRVLFQEICFYKLLEFFSVNLTCIQEIGNIVVLPSKCDTKII